MRPCSGRRSSNSIDTRHWHTDEADAHARPNSRWLRVDLTPFGSLDRRRSHRCRASRMVRVYCVVDNDRSNKDVGAIDLQIAAWLPSPPGRRLSCGARCRARAIALSS